MRLLIAEDDRVLSGFLCRALCAAGDEVAVASDGEAALALFAEREPDLLLLDLQLPGRSGHEVLAAVRDTSSHCAVMVLSGIAGTETRIACLELGADDCMAKPFSLGELRARCARLLQRRIAAPAPPAGRLPAAPADSATVALGSLRLERMRRRVEVDGVAVRLTNREFGLLEQLLLAGGAPVGRAELRQRVWENAPAEANVVDVHLGALRRKLAAVGGAPAIATVRGVGYRLASGSGADRGLAAN